MGLGLMKRGHGVEDTEQGKKQIPVGEGNTEIRRRQKVVTTKTGDTESPPTVGDRIDGYEN